LLSTLSLHDALPISHLDRRRCEPRIPRGRPPPWTGGIGPVTTPKADRVPLIAGNWKLNQDHLQAIALVQKLAWTLQDGKHDHARSEEHTSELQSREK